MYWGSASVVDQEAISVHDQTILGDLHSTNGMKVDLPMLGARLVEDSLAVDPYMVGGYPDILPRA